jgi:hypothetical protein
MPGVTDVSKARVICTYYKLVVMELLKEHTGILRTALKPKLIVNNKITANSALAAPL